MIILAEVQKIEKFRFRVETNYKEKRVKQWQQV